MCGGVVVWFGVVFFTDNNTTPTKVLLSCFGLLVGLWQYRYWLDPYRSNPIKQKCKEAVHCTIAPSEVRGTSGANLGRPLFLVNYSVLVAS